MYSEECGRPGCKNTRPSGEKKVCRKCGFHAAVCNRNARAHVFATYHKWEGHPIHSGFQLALNLLDSEVLWYITPNTSTGIRCELVFYHFYRKELSLTPSLDCGDHTDFSGAYNGRPIKIDVTKKPANKTKGISKKWEPKPSDVIVAWPVDSNGLDSVTAETEAYPFKYASAKDLSIKEFRWDAESKEIGEKTSTSILVLHGTDEERKEPGKPWFSRLTEIEYDIENKSAVFVDSLDLDEGVDPLWLESESRSYEPSSAAEEHFGIPPEPELETLSNIFTGVEESGANLEGAMEYLDCLADQRIRRYRAVHRTRYPSAYGELYDTPEDGLSIWYSKEYLLNPGETIEPTEILLSKMDDKLAERFN